MNPPIKVEARHGNGVCALIVAGADGDPVRIEAPELLTPYEVLHAVRGPLERVMNDVLAAHGITPPAPPTPEPPPVAEAPAETDPEATIEDAPKRKRGQKTA